MQLKEDAMEYLRQLPVSGSCDLVDFDYNDIVHGFVNDVLFLVVSGEKPCKDMEIKLVPFVLDRHADYWRIQVVGCHAGTTNAAPSPYFVSIPLDGIIGKKGIELIGAGRSVKILKKDLSSIN
jgi:hypothetical protein